MEMQMEFIRKLPSPQELMQDYPLGAEALAVKAARDKEIKDIFSGTDDRFILVIGPCSADNEDAVLDYVHRLAGVQEKVKDKLMLIPRVYTNKPRTIGVGYKGMLHQANPEGKEDMLAGITAIRKMHVRVVQETGLTSAEEILYPENHRYLSDILSYAAIGARSVEDQLHRMIASGVGIPVGMKNPTGGDIGVMMNSIEAAQHEQSFLFHGWEVRTKGNPLAHEAIRWLTPFCVVMLTNLATTCPTTIMKTCRDCWMPITSGKSSTRRSLWTPTTPIPGKNIWNRSAFPKM